MATPPPPPRSVRITLDPAGVARIDWGHDAALALGARWHIEQEVRDGYLPAAAWPGDATLAAAAPGDLTQLAVALVAWLRGQEVEPALAASAAAARLAHGCGRRYELAAWLARPSVRWPLFEGGWMDVRRCDCGSHVSLGGLVLIGPPEAG